MLEDIQTRHDATLEKIFGHPVRITLYLVKVEQRFMTKNPISVNEDTLASKALSIMNDKKSSLLSLELFI